METLCHEMGGGLGIDLGDGNYILDFSNTDITNQDLENVMRVAAELPYPLPLDYSGNLA
jgi:hypothetical protein